MEDTSHNNTITNIYRPNEENLISMTNQSLTLDLERVSYKCLKCQLTFEGVFDKLICPRCGNSDPDKFADL